MRRWKKRLAVVAALVGVLALAWLIDDQFYRYPYGRSHCCDKQLMMALEAYADEHDGWFPKGEASPEASLSLLHRHRPDMVNANLLRGKIVPEEAVRARLDNGELLTPDTCGWHYVEGLRKGDHPRLALFWDKAGLGHNGQRRWRGGHDVWFVNDTFEFIADEQWDQFLAEQQQLRANLIR